MRRAVIAMLAMVAMAVAAPVAGAEQCPPPQAGEPKVKVVIRAPETEYRRDYAKPNLTMLARYDQVLGLHDHALGLTVSRFIISFETSNWAVRLPSGEVCAGVRHVDAVLEIPEMTVYVAAEYPRGSCESRAVTAHENEHVRRTRALLRPFGRQLKRRMEAAAKRVTPVVAADHATAKLRISEALDAAMHSVMADLDAERRRVNGAIDTPESYARVLAKCRNW